MMSSLHDFRGVTSAFIYNFRLPFAYVSYYSQLFLNLNLTVAITDHNLKLVENLSFTLQIAVVRDS